MKKIRESNFELLVVYMIEMKKILDKYTFNKIINLEILKRGYLKIKKKAVYVLDRCV